MRTAELSTNAVRFGPINEVLVTDQHEPYTRMDLSGSIFTQYVTGSMVKRSNDFSSKFLASAAYVTGSRNLIFDTTSTSGIQRLNNTTVKDYFLPPSDVAGMNGQSFTVHQTFGEKLWDSCAPSISSILSIAGQPIYCLFDPPDGSERKVAMFERSISLISGTNTPHIRFFPFEPKYAAANRRAAPETRWLTREHSDSRLSYGRSIEWIDGYAVYYTQHVLSGAGNAQGATLGTTVIYTAAFLSASSPLVLTSSMAPFGASDIQKMHYGIGSAYGCTQLGATRPDGTSVMFGDNNEPSFYAMAKVDIAYGPLIRGWKYGLVNGSPVSSMARWRRSKFGQFRDMLEQRLHSQCFDETAGAAGDPIVKVTFLDSSGRRTEPLRTWSSNCSTAATSSLPYFDLVARNRPPIDVETLNSANYTTT